MAPWAELSKKARAKTGLTQREFSQVIGATRSTVAAWEAGLREPSRLTLSLMCLIESLGTDAMNQLRRCHRRLDRMAGEIT